jgi:hypothetical protein
MSRKARPYFAQLELERGKQSKQGSTLRAQDMKGELGGEDEHSSGAETWIKNRFKTGKCPSKEDATLMIDSTRS